MKRIRSIEDWRDLVRDRVKIDENGCWRWQRGKNPSGRGMWNIRLESPFCSAHRASYRIFKGEIPIGLEIDHLCEVVDCVNPDHLEAVTGVENRRRTRSQFCQENHFGPESRSGLQNTCQICAREWDRLYHLENREAIRERHRLYRLENREAIMEQGRLYRSKHREEAKEYRRLYRLKNLEAIRERERLYRGRRSIGLGSRRSNHPDQFQLL